nr:retrotransposable element Tf2 [Tanacetum cinerariifolium]
MAAVDVPQTLEYRGGQLNAAPVLEVENFTNWKNRFMCHIIGIEPQFENIISNSPFIPMVAGQKKPEKKMRQDVKTFVALCEICHRSKPDLVAYPGLLQPLPIPNLIWSEITMDFIEGLLVSFGKSIILLFVDRLSQISVDVVDRSLSAREAIVQLLKFHLQRVQQKMKVTADNRMTYRVFKIGQWVYLKLQPRRQVTVRKLGKMGNSDVVYVLIQWSNCSTADATWDLHSDIVKRFHEFPINS